MRWREPTPIPIPDDLQNLFANSPYLVEALVKRGIQDINHARAFLDPQYYSPSSPTELPGMEAATQRILRAIDNKETIGVWGDFDVDGQTSTTLLVSFFRTVNVPVFYHIPIRNVESHGIQKKALQTFLSKGIDLLITCDTGISAHDALAYAQKARVDVIITDHHTPPDNLPPALAAINPHFVEKDHPLSGLAGVGAAYMLTKQLANKLGMGTEWDEECLDLVAMGTIADVAPLQMENRYLVQRGLDLMRTKPRLAIREILRIADLPVAFLDEQAISFTLAPRMNALGRLSDANPIVDFLLSTDTSAARQHATELEGLNNKRKMMVTQIYQAAIRQIEMDDDFDEKSIIILANPNWAAGVLGIVANHLVTYFGKPTILLTGGKNETWRGSARSVEGINITQHLQKLSSLLISFGGHAMAAGMTLEKNDLDIFVHRMNQEVAKTMEEERVEPALAIDAYLSLDQVDEIFMQTLNKLAPFGAGNPNPLFLAKDIKIQKDTYLGKDKIHRNIVMESPQGNTFSVKWWHAFATPLHSTSIDLAYTIRHSTFRGEQNIEITFVDAHPVEREEITLPRQTAPIEVADFRIPSNQLTALQNYLSDHPALCWGENLAAKDLPTKNRMELSASSTLVLAHMPPSADVMQEIFNRVQPERIVFFDLAPRITSLQYFLETVMGMLKYALRKKDGRISIHHFATLTGYTAELVLQALHLLQAEGKILIQPEDDDRVTISTTSTQRDISAVQAYQENLKNTFREVRAFQRFLMRITPEMIVRDYYVRRENK